MRPPQVYVMRVHVTFSATLLRAKQLVGHQGAGRDIEEVARLLRELVSPVFCTISNVVCASIICSCIIQDLQRLAAHEQLEAETITASVLRHKVNTFPNKLRQEATSELSS